MLTHSIAGLKVGIDYKYPRMIAQSAAYVTEPSKTDFDIVLPDGYLEFIQNQNPDMSMDECEYFQTGVLFYRNLVNYSGMLLHASAVIKDGFAYLFSAPSGTGKSTHTSLWLKKFSDAKILNDDKPAIRVEGDVVNVYGTPWSGKTDLNLNLCARLAGICFLERAKENSITQVSSSEAISLILNQTIRPRMQDNMDKLLSILDKVVEKTHVYKMGCNISLEAAELAYNTMKIK